MRREVSMGKVIDCGEVAPDSGCTHVVRGKDEQEALRNAEQHARNDHGLEPTPELMARVRAAMRDE
jgi:predicted small metal-binding protein